MSNKTYNIITIGCQMNKSDSERLAAALEKRGYQWRADKYSADLVAVNTCGVRQSAEDRVYGLIPKIKKANPGVKVILTGCLAGRPDVRRRLKECVDVWLPIFQISKFPISNKFQMTNIKCQNDYLKIKPKYSSKFSAFVPVGNGCNNFCSYCVVPHARGRETYRPAGEILAEAENLVKRGYKEIVLIAQNVNSYKSKFLISNFQFLTKSQIPNPNDQINAKLQITNFKKGSVDFADLLQMVNGIAGNFVIRFATSHPKDMSDKLIRTIAQCEKVAKEIHLPVQSGDNQILKKMNRQYAVGHYKKIIKKIRRLMPDAKITTDIIVGFPGETSRQFNNTVKLFKEIKFAKAYIARYSPRPGTAAFKMADDVPAAEKKRRWEVLNRILVN
jgi:tRNA-2-methylthio-N6-dimethylallyladenosine synthase